MLKPANITPIRLPHVYIELPNIGMSNLLAANSKDMVTAPETKTSAVKSKENFLLFVEINIINRVSFKNHKFAYKY